MGRGASIKLFEVFGIRIGVDLSWFLVLFFVIFTLSQSFEDVLIGYSSTVAYVTAVGSALLFFASIVAHELGHALIARRRGIQIEGIDLWLFGGLARMRSEAETPGSEFAVAIAGPIVTALVAGVCAAAAILWQGAGVFGHALAFEVAPSVTPGYLLVSWLAEINLIVLVFNLAPAFPLDGGRIALATAWKVTGRRSRGIQVAASLGQAFAVLLGAWGLVLLFHFDDFYGIYFLLLAFLLGSQARGALRVSAFRSRLGAVRVRDVMDHEPVTMPADLPIARARNEFFLRYRWPWFAVVDSDGRFLGIVREQEVSDAEQRGEDWVTVRAITDADQGDWQVGTDAPLDSVLGAGSLARSGAVMAVDAQGVLRGVVTVEQVRRALQGAG
jgi:Zn-dependent protease